MPQFVVIARDAQDEGALERRLAVREAHIKACDLAVETGQQIYGAALLTEDGKMCGSVMVFEMERPIPCRKVPLRVTYSIARDGACRLVRTGRARSAGRGSPDLAPPQAVARSRPGWARVRWPNR